MGCCHGRDAFRRGDQDQRLDVLAALAFEHVHGGHQRAAGGQHRVDDHRQTLVQLADEALEIGFGHQRLVVAGDADDADLGVGNQVEHAVQHADAGAQDGYDGDLLPLI